MIKECISKSFILVLKHWKYKYNIMYHVVRSNVYCIMYIWLILLKKVSYFLWKLKKIIHIWLAGLPLFDFASINIWCPHSPSDGTVKYCTLQKILLCFDFWRGKTGVMLSFHSGQEAVTGGEVLGEGEGGIEVDVMTLRVTMSVIPPVTRLLNSFVTV